jgi:ribonuclease P protein component
MPVASAPVTLTRLQKRKDFLAVAATKKRFILRDMMIQYQRRDEGKTEHLHAARVGFTVTKKHGSAVIRNRIRRRLREATRALLPSLAHAGYDYVFIAKAIYATCPYEKILDDIRFAFGHIHKGDKPKKPKAQQAQEDDTSC